jgi:hypothetical protein
MNRHIRKLIPLLMAGVSAVALAAVTWHSGPDFIQNAGDDGSLNTADDTFSANGDGSGFGNNPAEATIVLAGNAQYTCQNKGGNVAPGANPVPAITQGSAPVQLSADHNGRGTFDLGPVGPLTPAETVGGRVAGCPNGNWTGIDGQLCGDATATLTVTQQIKGTTTVLYTETITYFTGPDCPTG